MAGDRLLIYTRQACLSSRLLNFFQSFSISCRPFKGGFELPRSKRFFNVHPFLKKCKPAFRKFCVFFREKPRPRGDNVRSDTDFEMCGAGGANHSRVFLPLGPLFSAGHPDHGVKRPQTFLARLGLRPAFGEKPLSLITGGQAGTSPS